MLWIEARAEEMLMTRGSGERWRRGVAREVRRAAEVMFVSRMRL
jgi:hypothetical protein